ncbi:hypothetical protein F5882DRAFT_378375 [Hyaloscypha sp. PMI_1271]|nr:hypothetical protein F5882DRAFT_378375 [Hyaloscypha sp. PMI_1271]
MSESISLPFSATYFIIWSPPALDSVRNTPGACKLKIRGSFSGANSQMDYPKVYFCCDAASSYHPTRTSYSHSKRHQTISPFLDAEPQFIMELPTSKILQTFHLSTLLPSELQLKIWRYAISSTTSLIVQITNLQALRYSTPTAKFPSPPLVLSPPSYTPLTPPALSRSQRWLLSFPFSTAGGGANTLSHPPEIILYNFSRG